MTDAQLQQKRLIAAGIDIGVVIALFILLGIGSFAMTCAASQVEFLGTYGTPIISLLVAVIGLGYMLGRDVLAGDRSLGKKLMNVRVVRVSGEPISIVDSAKRNALFAPFWALNVLTSLLQLVPFLGTCVACALTPLMILSWFAGLVAVIWEVVEITRQPDGARVGDRIAGTRVIF
jgi:uncharacterized RDD family membrane protein YckC